MRREKCSPTADRKTLRTMTDARVEGARRQAGRAPAGSAIDPARGLGVVGLAVGVIVAYASCVVPASAAPPFASAVAERAKGESKVSAGRTSATMADDVPPPSTAPVTGGRAGYRALIREQAKVAGIPPDLAEVVAEVESSLDPGVLGAAGEVGLMQVLPSTARMLGFKGTIAELADPATNVRYGVLYLATAWRLAANDLCTTVMKYRAGHGESRFSHRSVDYCLKVRAKLAARGYPVVGSVPAATFGEPVGSWGRARLGRTGGPNLATLNAQLRAIVSQVAVARTR